MLQVLEDGKNVSQVHHMFLLQGENFNSAHFPTILFDTSFDYSMRPLPHFLLHIVVLVEDRLLVGRLNRNAFLEGRIFQFIVVPLRTADLVLNSSGKLSLNLISCHGDNRVGFEAEPYGVHFLFSCLFFLEW